MSRVSTPFLSVRRAPDATAIIVMVLLCGAWGFQQVAIKEANASIPPMLQAGIRSLIATVLVWIWTRTRGVSLFQCDDTLPAGLLAGVLLLGGEFVCIFFGLSLTTATRMAISRGWRSFSKPRRASPRSACTGSSRVSGSRACSGAASHWRFAG